MAGPPRRESEAICPRSVGATSPEMNETNEIGETNRGPGHGSGSRVGTNGRTDFLPAGIWSVARPRGSVPGPLLGSFPTLDGPGRAQTIIHPRPLKRADGWAIKIDGRCFRVMAQARPGPPPRNKIRGSWWLEPGPGLAWATGRDEVWWMVVAWATERVSTWSWPGTCASGKLHRHLGYPGRCAWARRNKRGERLLPVRVFSHAPDRRRESVSPL